MVDIIGGNQIALGTKQYLLVSVTDMAASITDLSSHSPKYTVKDDLNVALYNLATGSATAMVVYCLIDTNSPPAGTFAVGHYRLWAQFTISPEVPLLGPFDFYVV